MAVQGGKSFGTAELTQLCYSAIHVSQDPCDGLGQGAQAFWDRVAYHYNGRRPAGTEERSSKSIESKFSEVKRDVARFVGCYETAVDSNVSRLSKEDILRKAKDFYVTKHKKGRSFTYVGCWEILKDYPLWITDMAKGTSKTTDIARGAADIGNRSFEKENVPPSQGKGATKEYAMELNSSSSTGLKRPLGCKQSKDSLKTQKMHEDYSRISAFAQKELASADSLNIQKMHEDSFRISALAQKEMASAQSQSLKILRHLFVMNLLSLQSQHMDEQERQFLKSWRSEEMKKIRSQFQDIPAQEEPSSVPFSSPIRATRSAIPISSPTQATPSSTSAADVAWVPTDGMDENDGSHNTEILWTD